MLDALIGYTGFVGSNLANQHVFNQQYNSKNIQEMRHKSFDLVVCAGVSAVKWQANKDPETDKKNINTLREILTTIDVKKFILISTIDVYPVMLGVDEAYDCREVSNHPYGTHRLDFEGFCKEEFPDCQIVRLPGLFGHGLKKNILFDLLNDNCLDMINPESTFQYYCLDNLWVDIQKAIMHDLKLINFFTEPVTTKEILEKFFPQKQVGENRAHSAHYDLRTRHASIWGCSYPYVYSRDEILAQVEDFVNRYQGDN